MQASMQRSIRHIIHQREAVYSLAFSPSSRAFSVLPSAEFQNFQKCQMIQPQIRGQQIRFRRHDRSSAFSKPRPKTKKQRQSYNRRIKRVEEEKAKHRTPGAKAGPRRQFIRERWQQLLARADGKELATLGDDGDDEYGIGDAIMEDILGNTAHLTSQPTPEPLYLGHMHQQFYDIVADQMENYKQSIENKRLSKNQGELLDISADTAELPSDEAISKVLRAYRDRNGTRRQPVGIASALEHILRDLGVPIFAFGEYTYTSLMTCCRTPKEARRIMKLMNDQQHPVSAYSWSILVDIHARTGDFEGCVSVVQEMARDGVPPPQAAYTSLLAACYKVCNDGRIPHAIRAKAGEIGWKYWQEMRIVGIEADAMAYGAIIRLCAARGQAERAINLLEEMNRFDVKPTTLCFSGALRAVARSHEIGVRFERGSSRKQLRRELFAAHHGKMTRDIVVMAESAEVEQDESFVSALMLCAAAAGDSATAKAVYLASEVRKMDHLRTIGPDSSRQLFLDSPQKMIKDGDANKEARDLRSNYSEEEFDGSIESAGTLPSLSSDDTSSLSSQHRQIQLQNNFGEREYGSDTRSLSALLKSCGQAMSSNGLGTMWAGRTNQGYLCENSLRLITTRWEPEYSRDSIPDEISTKVGISSLRRFDENDLEFPRKKGAARQNFRGLYLDDEAEDLIDDYSTMYDGRDSNTEDDDAIEFLSRGTRNQHDQSINGSSHKSAHQHNENGVPDRKNTLNGEFETFFAELKAEAQARGMKSEFSEEEAREMFEEFQSEFDGMEENSSAYFSEGSDGENVTLPLQNSDRLSSLEIVPSADILDSRTEDVVNSEHLVTHSGSNNTGPGLMILEDTNSELDEAQQHRLQELQAALPGLPLARVRGVAKAFEDTLGYPSLLSLVPLLRENLPDELPHGWLKKMNLRNADFVMEKAKEDGAIDISLLNSMLQVKTSASSLSEAENFHRQEFRKYNVIPTAYSDRLVLQMFVENGRLTRAFDFKRRIEKEKRTLDLPSYGTIIDYCARHQQLGSAMNLLNECIAQHGAPPSEKYLSKMRVLTKQLGIGDVLDLDRIIGEDPTEWLKYGERYLKREKSKRGKRDIQMAKNRILG